MDKPPDLTELKRLAIFAIHGDATEWYTEERLRELFDSGVYPSPSPDTDARFVAAASPEAILALIEYVESVNIVLNNIALSIKRPGPDPAWKLEAVHKILDKLNAELSGGQA